MTTLGYYLIFMGIILSIFMAGPMLNEAIAIGRNLWRWLRG